MADGGGATRPALKARGRWHQAVQSVQSNDRAAVDNGLRDAAVEHDAGTVEEAKQLFGASGANSSPSIIERVPGLSSLWSKEQQVVCVCVLLRCAYGMPKECRTYAKVSLGAGKSCRTHYITGTSSPSWTQLFAFDVADPEHATLTFTCKHKRHLAHNESLGRATLRLSEVSSQPERYSEPYKLPLHPASTGRALEFQVFMSTQGKLAELTGPSGSISVLAATWNVGNALPPPPEQLKQLWLRGSGGRGEHHLVAVSAQECSYLKDTRRLTSSPSREDVGYSAPLQATQERSGLTGTESIKLHHDSAAAGACEVLDTTADEDDEEVEEGWQETRRSLKEMDKARMSQTRSLRNMLSQNLDSALAWEAHIDAALGPRYWLVGAKHMFQTRILVYARMDVVPFVTDVWAGFEATGIGRVGLNKGGVAVCLKLGATQLAFVGSHLAAHQSQWARRNHDVGEIIQELYPPGWGEGINLLTGPHHTIWMGDLNYRVDWGQQSETKSETPNPEDHTAMVRLVKQQQYDKLLACDQLAREMEAGKVFSGFVEAPIAFPPTFKVIKGHPGLQYGMKRSPAWCDRVLVRSNLPHKAVRFEDYYCCPEIATSDHKPVAATMQLPLAVAPAPGAERRPYRLYLCHARLLDGLSWRRLAELMDKRVLANQSTNLKLLVSGPILAGGSRKQHVVHLDMECLRTGCSGLVNAARRGNQEAAEEVAAGSSSTEAARRSSMLRGEASVPLLPTNQAAVRDSKLVLRLCNKEGFHMHTLAAGVLPLCAAADDFKARRFKPTGVVVALETSQGVRVGHLRLETQLFCSVRTRSIVADAVRRMRLLAAAKGRSSSRAASASAAHPPPIASNEGVAASLTAVRSLS